MYSRNQAVVQSGICLYQQPEGFILSHERENIKDNKGNGEFGGKEMEDKGSNLRFYSRTVKILFLNTLDKEKFIRMYRQRLKFLEEYKNQCYKKKIEGNLLWRLLTMN